MQSTCSWSQAAMGKEGPQTAGDSRIQLEMLPIRYPGPFERTESKILSRKYA